MKHTNLFSGAAFISLGLLVSGISIIQAQATQNIVELAQATPSLSTLVTAVTEAELVDTLSDGSAEYTVFAPTNDAFDALPEGTLDSLLAEGNQDDLTNVLTYHVVDTEAFASDLSDGQTLNTLNGETLTVNIDGSDVFINDARVTTADVDATNGVVHIIDSVLLPEGIAEAHSTADTSGEVQSTSSIEYVVILLGLIAGTGMTIMGFNKLNS
ncbi:MAG: fasciclin domain-containing protein [Candidatus Dojkabacteria bacterium]